MCGTRSIGIYDFYHEVAGAIGCRNTRDGTARWIKQETAGSAPLVMLQVNGAVPLVTWMVGEYAEPFTASRSEVVVMVKGENT